MMVDMSNALGLTENGLRSSDNANGTVPRPSLTPAVASQVAQSLGPSSVQRAVTAMEMSRPVLLDSPARSAVVPPPEPVVATQAPPILNPLANVVRGSKLTEKGTALSFIAPSIKNGSPVALLEI